MKYMDPDGRISIGSIIRAARNLIYSTKVSFLMQTTDLGRSKNALYSTSLYQQQYMTTKQNAEDLSNLVDYVGLVPGPVGEIATTLSWLNPATEQEGIVTFDSRLNFIAGASNEINHIDSILENLSGAFESHGYGKFLNDQKAKLQDEIRSNKKYDSKQVIEITKAADFYGAGRYKERRDSSNPKPPIDYEEAYKKYKEVWRLDE